MSSPNLWLRAGFRPIPLGILSAHNMVPWWVLQPTRRLMDLCRAIHEVVFAVLFVVAVGLGPFAGVLAIVTSDIGTFGKLYSEAIEAVDRKAAEGVASTGGNRLHSIRYGVLPQVLPVLAGQVLYMFESNTRSSSIIGIVGAGGIGLMLSEMIRTLEWPAVSMIVVLILIMVAAIDALSSRLRTAIAGAPSGH